MLGADRGGWRVMFRSDALTRRRRGILATARAALDLLRDFGVAGLVNRLRSLPSRAAREEVYRRWVATHAPTADLLARLAAEVAALPVQPVITIVTPVHDTDPAPLRACVDSVRRQVYTRWQLVLCDDASTRQDTRHLLEAFEGDARIDVLRLPSARNIAGATNEAVAAARGDFVAFLDHDDELSPDALAEVVRAINDHPDADVVYSDEDKLDEGGRRTEAFFKPDWSPEYLLSTMYVGHLMVVRRELLRVVGGLRDECSGSQDHDLILRLAERTSRVHHVPKVLYHWRKAAGSAASAGAGKPWASEAAVRALSDHLRRRGIAGTVTRGSAYGQYRVRLRPPDGLASVVVIGDVAGADVGRALGTRHGAAHVEWLIARGAADSDADDVRLVESVPAEKWAAFANRAARQAAGSCLVFVSATLEPVSPDWLASLLGFAALDGIGAAGARILSADGHVFHAGLVTGIDGGCASSYKGARADAPGYFWNLHGLRNCAAVSGACLVTTRAAFEDAGGFDEAIASGADVDYCLKVREGGRRVVYVPDAVLRWTGRPPAAFADTDAAAMATLVGRWGPSRWRDPYYNVNFGRHGADFELSNGIG